MKFKNLFRVLTLLTLAFSLLGASQPAQAMSILAPAAEPVIISYDMTVWNATYPGTVSDLRYEKWAFTLAAETDFIATATPTSGDLVADICLLDAGGNELSCSTGALSSTQAEGKYYLLVKPQSGSGGYNLTLRVAIPPSSSSVSLDPSTIHVDEFSTATVSLSNVPAEGFTSAEFTCTYDPAFVEVSGITDAGLFGADAVMVVNGPANGSFILAIAGSNGKKATTNGAVFTYTLKGLQVGQTPVNCTARTSTGNNVLTAVASDPATLNIVDLEGTLLGAVSASKQVSVCVYDASQAEVGCMDVDEQDTFHFTLVPGEYTLKANAEGFLYAEGSATVTGNTETLMPKISLLAGDIDGNGIVDQFDAMTIGMSYNTPVPSAADLNNDANIDVLDLELLAANYRLTAPQPSPWMPQ